MVVLDRVLSLAFEGDVHPLSWVFGGPQSK